jgi:hypothetical protein
VQRLVVQEKAVQIMPAKNSPRSYQIPHRNIRQKLLQKREVTVNTSFERRREKREERREKREEQTS